MKKTAFVTGITGQDGSYLAELLLEKGYIVHGMIRRSSSSNTLRISHLLKDPSFQGCLFLHEGDLGDYTSIKRLIDLIQPDEAYNLAAMSHVHVSFDVPEYTANIDALGTLRLLEAIRNSNKKIRFYQASSSELFGKVQEIPQSESTPFYPRSPYAVSKLYAYWSVVNYREAYDLFACNGILFNHESPRRGETFVTRKITQYAAKIYLGMENKLLLGNLNAKRDWGYAKDYVEGMWRMLQEDQPDDYVLATGKTTTVRDFVEQAFRELDINIDWEGTGVNEVGINRATGKVVVEVSPEYFRPTDVELLIGDSSKAHKKLGWKPSTDLNELIRIMIQSDLESQRALLAGQKFAATETANV